MIENADSREYLAVDNHWTKIPADGKNFPHSSAAFDAARKESVGKFNIVGYITETKQLINLNHGRGRGVVETQPA